MSEFFTARGLPVPLELQRNPLTDWRRLLPIAVALVIVYIGLRITDINLSHSNPTYMFRVIGQLFNWDFSILTPPPV